MQLQVAAAAAVLGVVERKERKLGYIIVRSKA